MQVKRFRCILIDEFQDGINAIQSMRLGQTSGTALETICLSSAMMTSLSIVFAVVQSRRLVLNFQKDFPSCGMIQLAENYRSTECIIKGAGRVISSRHQPFSVKAHMASAETEREDHNLSFRIRQMEATRRLSKSAGYAARRKRAAGDRSSVPTNTGARIYLEKFMEYQLPVPDAGRTTEYLRTLDRKRSVYLRTNGNRSQEKIFL